MDKKRRIFNNGYEIVLLIGFIVGILFCIFIPYGAGFDEETHILRIYDLSGLNFIPNQGPDNQTVGFGEFFTLSYQRRYFQTPASDLFEPDVFNLRANYESMAITKTRSIYSPMNFLPQAFMAGVIWRFLDFPIIPGVILLRLSGFIFYSLIIYYSVKIIPIGKWVLSILAFLPTSLFQATTLNADVYTNSISFLFIAVALFFIINKDMEISNGKKFLFYGTIILLGFAKPASILLLGLLILLPFKKFSIRDKSLLVLACLISIGANVGWFIASVNGSGFEQGGDKSLIDSLQLVLQSPFDFISTLFIGLVNTISPYYKAWLAAYGYWVGVVPKIIYWLFLPLIFVAIILDNNENVTSKKTRISLIIIFLFCVLGITAMHLLARYSPGDYSVLGRQGRYFIPFTPLVFISFIGIFKLPKLPKPIIKYSVIFLFTSITFFFSLGMVTTYYSYCGLEKLTNQACYLPKYKNLEIENSPAVLLNDQNSISQTFFSMCENVEGIDIYVQSIPSKEGYLNFSLVDSNNNIKVEKEFRSDLLLENSFNSIEFSEKLNMNEIYTIKFESNGLMKPNSVGIGMRVDEVYEGELRINNKYQEGDLIFRYLCSVE